MIYSQNPEEMGILVSFSLFIVVATSLMMAIAPLHLHILSGRSFNPSGPFCAVPELVISVATSKSIPHPCVGFVSPWLPHLQTVFSIKTSFCCKMLRSYL